MKKIFPVLFFFVCGVLFADDYRWEYVNALSRNDFAAAEKIINQNINSIPPQERRMLVNYALSYSRGENTLKVLQFLQTHGINPSAFDLFTAIDKNQPDNVVQFILNNGVSANGEILLLAMEKQRFDLARQFILGGTDVNYQYPASSSYADGMTALLHASTHNNFELVQLLAEKGANINARNKDGSTALSIAQMNGNAQISDFLIQRGAAQTGNPNRAASRDTGVSQAPLQQTGGIGDFLDGQNKFLPGTYRLHGSGRDLIFSGNESAGRVGFTKNGRMLSGVYQTNGGILTLIMDGQSFVYNIDSNSVFSGYGERWVRSGN